MSMGNIVVAVVAVLLCPSLKLALKRGLAIDASIITADKGIPGFCIPIHMRHFKLHIPFFRLMKLKDLVDEKYLYPFFKKQGCSSSPSIVINES